MRFKVKNSNIFPIPHNPHMLHLGTISYSLREFIVMYCRSGIHRGKCYIEEVVLTSTNFSEDVFANLKFIADDNLANDLAMFAGEQKLTDLKRISDTLIDTSRSHLLG